MFEFKRVSLVFLTASTLPVFALTTATSKLPTSTIVVPLTRNVGLSAYYAEFQVGTPPQKVLLKVDTGSPRYAFLDPRNPSCVSGSTACTTFGTFDNLTSSTCRYVDSGFQDALVDYGSGYYLRDTFKLGGVSVEDMFFGYTSFFAFSSHVYPPISTIAGLSLECQFGGPGCDGKGAYLLPELKNASAIDYMSVSFYLGSDDANITSAQMILGGAYDKAKVDGELFTVNMVDPRDAELANSQTNSVNVTAMEFVSDGGNRTSETYGEKNVGVPVLLDTGVASWYMTKLIFNAVFAALGGSGEPNRASPYQPVDCKYRDSSYSKSYLSVQFGTAGAIKVPLNSLVTKFADGTCGSFIYARGDTINTFGVAFLRSAYIVYDQENLCVSLGQVKHSNKTEVVAFPKGGFKPSP
ncbi:related to aspartic proteinase OPSB [Rhynchosporium graminicola]|uniref:Related to aspartic proteinase OPSB n=1 Tax=Rhynchosporium graminicola TaxID=2792576 RepID=A0A1E1L944_9HELO|nr:related to aspartic proteinase OPSB [Rhynchosporium commune]